MTVRRIGLAKRPASSEITAIDPPQRWSVRGMDGPIRALVDVMVDPLDEARRSRLTITIDFQGHGIGMVLVPLVVRREARAEMPANLQALKRRLAGRHASASVVERGGAVADAPHQWRGALELGAVEQLGLIERPLVEADRSHEHPAALLDALLVQALDRRLPVRADLVGVAAQARAYAFGAEPHDDVLALVERGAGGQ